MFLGVFPFPWEIRDNIKSGSLFFMTEQYKKVEAYLC